MAKLEFTNGRPAFVVDGKLLSYGAYHDMASGAKWLCSPEQWFGRIKSFVGSGIHLFSIQPDYVVNDNWGDTQFWLGDGMYPDVDPDKFFCLDKQAKGILKMNPDAKFVVRISDYVPKAWTEANRNLMQQGHDGFYSRQPSLASEKARDDIIHFLKRIVTYCESKAWAQHVIGYAYYPQGEGITELNCAGYFFDQSPVMQESFRNYLHKKYTSDTELRTAWGDDTITRKTAKVPTDPEWQTDKQNLFHFIEGNQLQNVRDYAALQRELFMEWYKTIIFTMKKLLPHRLFGLDIAKQSMFGWQLQLAFSGTLPGADFPNILYASGSIGISELLDQADFDFIATPADYTARNLGCGWEPEGIADSVKLRGKAFWVENDSRSYEEIEANTQGAFTNDQEAKAGLLRNLAASLSRGHMEYFATPYAAYFQPTNVQDVVKSMVSILDKAPHIPHIETEHAIAMIIDDESSLYENGTSGFQNLAVMWQRIQGLAHVGIPYRVYLFSDLKRENMPDYRAYIFPNLFKLDTDKLKVLENKVFRDGRIAIFGPATGITDGKTLSAEWALHVCGVEMELIRKHAPRRVVINGSNPITKNLPASTMYGDSLPYGPIIVPCKGAIEKAGGIVLGSATLFWGVNSPGLFAIDHGSHKIAWSVATSLPANLLRELARYGGCHVWSEEDDVVMASDTMVALHSIKDGQRKIKLPTPRNVTDLVSGKKIGDMITEIEFDITAPDTKIFTLA